MRRFLTLLTAAIVTTVTLTGSAGATGGGQSWVDTWGTAVTGAATPPQPETVFDWRLDQARRVEKTSSESRRDNSLRATREN